MKFILLAYLVFTFSILSQSDGFLGGSGSDFGRPSGDFGKPGTGVGNPPSSPPPSSGGVPAFGTPNHKNPYINQGGGLGYPGHQGGNHLGQGQGGRR